MDGGSAAARTVDVQLSGERLDAILQPPQAGAAVHLPRSFDLRGAYEDGVTYDGTGLGVYQDLVALRNDFGAAYTVGPPLAGEGATDVRFGRASRKRPRP